MGDAELRHDSNLKAGFRRKFFTVDPWRTPINNYCWEYISWRFEVYICNWFRRLFLESNNSWQDKDVWTFALFDKDSEPLSLAQSDLRLWERFTCMCFLEYVVACFACFTCSFHRLKRDRCVLVHVFWRDLHTYTNGGMNGWSYYGKGDNAQD